MQAPHLYMLCARVSPKGSALIAEIIMLDIDPIAKDAVLKKIQTFKQGE